MNCYLDDDTDWDKLIKLAAARGHDLLSPRSIGASGQHDALHFLAAVSRQLPILTQNVRDFEPLHRFAIGAGGHHFGLIVIYNDADRRKNMSINQIVSALTKLEATTPLADQLFVLNQYR